MRTASTGAVLLALALAGHARGAEAASSAAVVSEGSHAVLTVAHFARIQKFILDQGKRQTYCSRFNNNPCWAFSDFNTYLDPPDQGNINCEIGKTDFNTLVIHVVKPEDRYWRVIVDARENGLRVQQQSQAEPKALIREAAEFFEKALAEIDRRAPHEQSGAHDSSGRDASRRLPVERRLPLGSAPTQPSAATLKQWLQGKEVVEVCFAGPHMEPLALRDSLHTKVADSDRDFRLTPGEGGGFGSFVEVVMKVTPETIRRLMDLQAELAPRHYLVRPDRARVWSTVGDPVICDQARKLVPKVLAELGKDRAAVNLDAETRHAPATRGRFRYDLGEGNTGMVAIVEITPWKNWETEVAPDQSVHFPQLGLMVIAHYHGANVSPAHLAFRKALRDAVEPLLKLEPDVKVQTRPW